MHASRTLATMAAMFALGACARTPPADEKSSFPQSTVDTDVTDTDMPATPSDDTDVPADDTDTDAPVEDTDVPVEDTDVPVEDTGVVPPAISNLQVQVAGLWEGVCCEAGVPRLSEVACSWTEYDRILTDETGSKLFCPEGDPAACWCDATGEHLHGYGGGDLVDSILAVGGGPVYPDELVATCIFIAADGALVTDWTSDYCPYFQLDPAP